MRSKEEKGKELRSRVGERGGGDPTPSRSLPAFPPLWLFSRGTCGAKTARTQSQSCGGEGQKTGEGWPQYYITASIARTFVPLRWHFQLGKQGIRGGGSGIMCHYRSRNITMLERRAIMSASWRDKNTEAQTIAGGHLDTAACWRRSSDEEKMTQLQPGTKRRSMRGEGGGGM